MGGLLAGCCWIWVVDRAVGSEKLGADGEGVRGIQYKFPSRSIADNGRRDDGFNSIDERDLADTEAVDFRLFLVLVERSGLVSGEIVDTFVSAIDCIESLDPRSWSNTSWSPETTVVNDLPASVDDRR